jgi:hypothetical protein
MHRTQLARPKFPRVHLGRGGISRTGRDMARHALLRPQPAAGHSRERTRFTVTADHGAPVRADPLRRADGRFG